ncbi:hypothetical protein O181_087870 [Austropuccinia psidii MF-1]|uniref:Retroviral polymerase SH3-like domain-containing protein n=1 Tax=Austropuccinia psidii MF-1 TaxID=1389203 RepID=A0A9Q3IQP9_9BASI|nr:hypothetical protein [Austropuccinia psidii MF-1]
MAIPRHHRKLKLAPSWEKGILLGYENNNTLYRILRLDNKKVAITKHTNFDESCFPNVDQKLSLTNSTTSTCRQQLTVETPSTAMVDDQSLPLDMVDELHAKDTSPTIKSTGASQTSQIKVIGL